MVEKNTHYVFFSLLSNHPCRFLFFMNFKKIVGFDNIFVDETTGVIFSVKDAKDFPLKLIPNTKKPTVNILGKAYSVISLLLNTYQLAFSDTDRMSFKINKTGFISPKSIKVKSIGNLTADDNSILLHYKCNIKAASANARFDDKISGGTILQVLKIADFKCIYCGINIDSNDWHLDHYHPRAFSGKNTMENIVPACSICNKMKGALDGINFLKRCKNICVNNKVLNSEERNKFASDWKNTMNDKNIFDNNQKIKQ